MTKFLFLIIVIGFCSCHQFAKDKNEKNISLLVDSAKNDSEKILEAKEEASTIKDTNRLGELKQTIAFNVKTDDKKDFENGIIPWARIDTPENDIPKLIDKNKIVVNDSLIKIIIDYPLTRNYEFVLKSKKGFTRIDLLKEISKNYYKLYAEEEKQQPSR